MGEHIKYYTGWPAIWVAERYLYPIYGLQQLDLYPIPIVICPCHHGFPRLFMDFPWFSHVFSMHLLLEYSFNCPRWRHLSEMISRRESMGISPKTRGVQMVSAIIINNHEDFIIFYNNP